jgi:hypothetical protein
VYLIQCDILAAIDLSRYLHLNKVPVDADVLTQQRVIIGAFFYKTQSNEYLYFLFRLVGLRMRKTDDGTVLLFAKTNPTTMRRESVLLYRSAIRSD